MPGTARVTGAAPDGAALMAKPGDLLTAEEVAAIRAAGPHYCGPETFERLCATLEARERDVLELAAILRRLPAAGDRDRTFISVWHAAERAAREFAEWETRRPERVLTAAEEAAANIGMAAAPALLPLPGQSAIALPAPGPGKRWRVSVSDGKAALEDVEPPPEPR